MRHKFFILLLLESFFILNFSCSDTKGLGIKEAVNHDTLLAKDFVKDRLFYLIDSVGYEVDTSFMLDVDNNEDLNFIQVLIWTYNNEKIFFENLESATRYDISQIDSLTSKSRKNTEIFRGTQILLELKFFSLEELEKKIIEYNPSFNFVNESGQKFSGSIYDLENKRIWFIKDRSFKNTPQLDEVLEAFSILSKQLE